MKAKLILLIFMMMSIISQAQDLSKTGQTYLKNFNSAIEKLNGMNSSDISYANQVKYASRQIENLKKSDPSYNVSSLESQLKKFEPGDENTLVGKQEIVQADPKVVEKFDELLYAGWPDKFLMNKKPAAEEMEQFVMEYSLNWREINAPLDSKLYGELLRKAENHWDMHSTDPTEIISSMKYADNFDNAENAMVHYYKMQFISIRWNMLTKIFPQNELLEEAKNTSAEAFKKLGSLDAVKRKAEETKANNTAKVRMSEALNTDAELLSLFKTLVSETQWGKNKTQQNLRITNSDWMIYRNALGIITHRGIQAEVIIKNEDGKCMLHQFKVTQDYDGSSYQRGTAGFHSEKEILCEHIDK